MNFYMTKPIFLSFLASISHLNFDLSGASLLFDVTKLETLGFIKKFDKLLTSFIGVKVCSLGHIQSC